MPENMPLFLLIFGLTGVVVLIGGLVLIWRMMQDEQKNKRPHDRLEDPQAVSSGLANLVRTPGASASSAGAGNANEVLRVLRDQFTGRLVIEFAGRRYHSLAEVHDPALQQGLVTTLLDLQAFVQNAPPAPAAPATPDWAARLDTVSTAASSATPPPPTSTAQTKDLPAATAAVAPQTGVAPTSGNPASIQTPSMNPFKQMQVLREMAKKPAPVFKSIPEQIDEILQTKVAGTPFAARGLRIGTNPQGAVQFEIDGQPYVGVGDLPDAAAANLVRAAVAEWEKR